MKFTYRKKVEEHKSKCFPELDCPICGKTFYRGKQTMGNFNRILRRHKKGCAVRQIRFNKTCPFCQLTFTRPASMRGHLKRCKLRPANYEDDDQDYQPDQEVDSLTCFYCFKEFPTVEGCRVHMELCDGTGVVKKTEPDEDK